MKWKAVAWLAAAIVAAGGGAGLITAISMSGRGAGAQPPEVSQLAITAGRYVANATVCDIKGWDEILLRTSRRLRARYTDEVALKFLDDVTRESKIVPGMRCDPKRSDEWLKKLAEATVDLGDAGRTVTVSLDTLVHRTAQYVLQSMACNYNGWESVFAQTAQLVAVHRTKAVGHEFMAAVQSEMKSLLAARRREGAGFPCEPAQLEEWRNLQQAELNRIRLAR